jgi:hypothetical protein
MKAVEADMVALEEVFDAGRWLEDKLMDAVKILLWI